MTSFVASLLEHRGIVRLGGEDRRAFLQGLISNDIALCTQGRAIHAALLTPQGKFLHDLFIVENGDEFLIDCEAARAEDLLRRLKAYKLRAKVTFENAADAFDVWVEWSTSKENLSLPFPRKRESSTNGSEEKVIPTNAHVTLDPRVRGEDMIIYTDPRLPTLGMRLVVKKGIEPSDIESANFAAYDLHRLTLGVADGSRDMLVEKSTLLEGNFDLFNGISWTKGCYVGQELTARMHYRALAKKRLFPVKIEGEAPAFGSIVKLGGEDIGDMRSSADGRGLALLNVEKAERAIRENATLDCGGSKLTPSKPEWMQMGNAPS